MSDLISRSDVLELQRYSFGVSMLNSEEYIKVSDVDNILTAYSVDKVVEKLDHLREVDVWKLSGYFDSKQDVLINKAIEIVKQGGVVEAEQKLK